MSQRLETVTRRVETSFESLYVHVEVRTDGTPHDVAISTPGKHHDTTIHDAFDAIGVAISAILDKPRLLGRLNVADETDDLALRPIEQLWSAYAELVLSMDPDAAGAEVARDAFMAGCMGLFGLLICTDEEEGNDAYQELCQSIHDELFQEVDSLAQHFGTKH